jgi:hypothetical protein
MNTQEQNVNKEIVRKILAENLGMRRFQHRWCHKFCLITRNSGSLILVLNLSSLATRNNILSRAFMGDEL